jgi:hypothetical protein
LSYWRYPIATSILKQQEANFKTLLKISKETIQKSGATLYTNIQNLSTGAIWFMSKHDPGVMIKFNINELLKKGNTSFSFLDLKALEGQRPAYKKEIKSPVKDVELAKWTGNYSNPMVGAIVIEKSTIKLRLTFANSSTTIFYPVSNSEFQMEGAEDFLITFTNNKELKFFENGFWSFTARKDD